MTVFALLGTSKNSLSTVTTATAPKSINTNNSNNSNINSSSSCHNPKNLDIGYDSINSSSVTTSTSTHPSKAPIKMEQPSQIGLAGGQKDANSVMISPLTCGEIPHRYRTYSSNSTIGHHTRALGMILFLVVVFSSTSSVLCVPLEQPELTGSFLSSKQKQQSPYDLESKGQLYLPSSLNPSQELRNDPSIYKPRFQIQENEDESLRSDNEWETVIDPHLYVLTEWNSNPILQQQRTRRDAGPSLSIVNPMDVLRQRLLLEIARRRMRQSHRQIMDNAEILKQIGRRK